MKYINYFKSTDERAFLPLFILVIQLALTSLLVGFIKTIKLYHLLISRDQFR